MQILLGQGADLIRHPHGRNCQRSLADTDVLVQALDRFEHLFKVGEGFPHAHKHHMADPLLEVCLDSEHLINNFVGLEVPGKATLPVAQKSQAMAQPT